MMRISKTAGAENVAHQDNEASTEHTGNSTRVDITSSICSLPLAAYEAVIF